MKIALVTDLHFGVRNDNAKVAQHQSLFFNDVFFPYIKENNIDTVIDLGDTFDRRKFISYTSLKAAKEMFFNPLKENGITLHCIVGNHDITYKNTLEVNSIDLLLDGYDNIIEYSDPKELTFDGCNILLMPWICKDNQEACWEAVKTTKSDILFGHLELNGFQMYKGMPSYDGFDPALFKNFDIVCSGHYHHRSTIENITYLGTAYEMTWSCYNDQKGFHIFDTETRELEFIPNPNTLFDKIWYDDSSSSGEQVMSVDFSQYKDKYVKVVVTAKEHPALFDVFIAALENESPINVQVVDDHLHLDLDIDEDIVNEAEDTLTIVNNYIDNLDVKTNRKELTTLMRTLYAEALSVE